ncbi:hypothetical protein E4188_23620 (plasmid) [Aeromonas media]|uniref:Uncharacterized protein n=1 Tax=Aeromonas media TaxID=651 RepID=A0ABX6P1Q2_AERME|nr:MULTISPECIES: hypothetical protein [Aeromonas]QLI59120.1 hypothetical protein C0708_23515 [Aeromonas caviae]ASI21300.1 hypothetical protein CE456_00125 [Aeromonas salmonicida]QJT41480.1 hypothetical protein E4188_23620 [Aeromonas media]HDN9373683.1 hypothetical protein [Aeromonas salmonicida]HDN9379569.1 hypothetical protein [Aeromonas salmonicida]
MNNSGGFVVLIAIAVLLVLFWLSKTIGVPLDVIVDSGRNLVPVIVVGAIVVLWGDAKYWPILLGWSVLAIKPILAYKYAGTILAQSSTVTILAALTVVAGFMLTYWFKKYV